MAQVTMAVRELARLLLEHEAAQSQAPADIAGAAERVCAKLRFHLARLVGLDGFLALFARSLALARAEVSWLSGVTIEPDGSPEGLRKVASGRDAVAATEGFSVLLAHTLGLLVLFIGEALTLRLVCDIWPQVRLTVSTLNTEEKTEG